MLFTQRNQKQAKLKNRKRRLLMKFWRRLKKLFLQNKVSTKKWSVKNIKQKIDFIRISWTRGKVTMIDTNLKLILTKMLRKIIQRNRNSWLKCKRKWPKSFRVNKWAYCKKKSNCKCLLEFKKAEHRRVLGLEEEDKVLPNL